MNIPQKQVQRILKRKIAGINPATAEQITAAKEKSRKKRVFLGGPFSGTNPSPWVGKVLGKYKLTIFTGGRLGPVKEVIEEAIGHGAKNISVIVEPWGEKFNPNIKGKARNIVAKGNGHFGVRPMHERLSILQTHKVKGYLFLYPGEAQFSGTMTELQTIINAHTLEPMTNKQWKRPILLIGEQWKPIYEQIKKDYSKRWDTIKDVLKIITNEEELEQALKAGE
jgi:hypothetical protein